MRIFPIALIVIGSLGVAKHFGLIPIGMLHLVGPLLLIALGAALLLRRPRLAAAIGAPAIAVSATARRSRRLPGWLEASSLSIRSSPFALGASARRPSTRIEWLL